jgi:serine/threonine-protein kinase
VVGELVADRYEVEELVGAGGMSSVYRAHDRLLDRKVALKVMHQHYGGDPEHVERFRREARSVAALSHPNVVTVIDRGEHRGRQFIVFEYVDGENLKQLIQRRGPAPVATALELAIQIAQALSFAHRHGLVHRDVKPQNVLLNGDGRAKVTDFGIARSLDVQQGVTQTGTVLGTSEYIAPEQAQGRNVDEQTDVYSLGVVLYELLSGHVPFAGENFVAVAMRHINDPPPPLADSRPDVPARVEAAVRRAMAKEPSDRFATMADLCAELEACLAELQGATQVLPGHSPPPPSPRRPPRRRASAWPVVVALALLICGGAAAGYFLLRSHGGSPSAGKVTVPPGGPTGTVALHGLRGYDPYGNNHQEDDAGARFATDGDPRTYWSTEHYYDAPSLDKPGVGLLLDAGRPVQLRQLGFSTDTPGFRAEIMAGNDPSSFHTVVAPAQVTTSVTYYSIRPGSSYRYYVIWITRLGGGTDHADINEVKAN